MARLTCALTAFVAVAILTSTTAAGTVAAAPTRQVDRRIASPRGDADPRFLDDRGRRVLLRGVNVNQLGDYYEDDPANPAVVPLTERDFAGVAALGMNVVRLIVNWSALEPTPGAFDAAYLARIRQAVEWAKAHDVYVILDMHQDAWGPHIATPPGTVCPAPMERSVGWDGAPEWATITDGLTTCRLEARELSPAVAQAFQSFWVDRDGIQSRLVATWANLAREFASEPAVAGYDLLNEPNPGFTPLVTGVTLLGTYYGRAIAAIRAAERSVPGGFAHTVFFEPPGEWSLLGVSTVPLPTFTPDTNLSFAPHLYAGSITADAGFGLPLTSIEQGFDHAELAAGTFGVPVFSGEWGWFGDPASSAPQVARYAAQEDARLVSGAWWSWKQACGDPHQIANPGTPPYAVSPSLNRYACPGDRELGIPPEFEVLLSRAYPRAAPGHIVEIDSDPSSGTLRVVGDTTAPGTLDLWIPDRGLGAPRTRDGSHTDLYRIGRGSAGGRAFGGGWRVHVPVPAGRYVVEVAPAGVVDDADGVGVTLPRPSLPATGGGARSTLALVLVAMGLASGIACGRPTRRR